MHSDEHLFPILIVDDTPANLFALEHILRDTRARIVRATSGDEALALSIQNDFALAILDVQMPGMDGYELAELLHGNPSTATIPIIFVSAAYRDEDHRTRGYASGAVDYLVKPLDAAALLGKVRVFLELARTRAELQLLVRERTRALESKAEQLARRARFKNLLSSASRDIVRRNPAEARQAVQAALGRVAETIDARFGFVLRGTTLDPQACDCLNWRSERAAAFALWTAAPTAERLTAMLRTPALARGDGIALDAHRLCELADVDAAALGALGVRSLVLLPIVEDVRTIGLVGFGCCLPPDHDRCADLPDLLAQLPEVLYSALERADAEARRAESEVQHRLLFDTMAQGVVYQNAKGAIITANAAAERMLGLTLAQMTGRDSMDPRWRAVREDGTTFPGDDHPASIALRTGRGVDGVTMGVFNPVTEDYRWIIISAVPLFRPGEATPSQVYTTFTDITELRRATEEKERLINIEAESRAKTQFLASMSHEIRTPLNAIIGYTQLLQREAGLTPRQREYLETVDRSGSHLVSLVNNVLDLARIEAGKDSLELADTDLVEMVTDLERMFRLRSLEKGLAFRVERAELGPRNVHIDAGKVRQVLINLLGNALKFTRTGEVVLRARTRRLAENKIRIQFVVRDTGVGIPSDKLEMVFEPFVQIERSRTASGTGIGLSVCKRYAELMGGAVAVASEEGVGSSFTFAFDADPTTGWAHDDRHERTLSLSSPPVRVLLVEDDRDHRSMLAAMMRSVGLSVRDACDIDAAMAELEKEPCDIVLTDMRLPTGDGLEVMRRLRRLPDGAAVPVVVVSASAMKEERDRAFEAGIDGFIAKPVREASLFDEISRLTGVQFSTDDSAGGDGLHPLPSAASLHMLSPDSRARLAAAVQSGYGDAIARAIDEIETVAPALARELGALADRFDYVALLEVAGGEVT